MNNSIAFVFPYRMYGGAEVVVRRLAHQAIKAGWRVCCFSLVQVEESVRIPFDGIETYDQPRPFAAPQDITEETVNKLKSFSVVCHHFLDKFVRQKMKASLPDAVFVDCIHSVGHASSFYSGCQGEKFDAVWFCDQTREGILKDVFRGIDCEIVYIPNPIDDVKYRGPIDGNLVTMMGRISPEKNQAEFVSILRSMPELSGVLVGGKTSHDPWYRDSVFASMAGSNTVASDGYVSDVYSVLRKARLVLHTSNEDNQPLTLLEAMAMGVPVVAKRVGGIPRFIRHAETGLLYDSPEDAIRCVRQVLGDKELECRITKNARQYIENTSHLADKVWVEYEKLFERLAGKKEKSPCRNKRSFYNHVNLGDCIWALNYFNRLVVKEQNTDVVFSCKEEYHRELEIHIWPQNKERIRLIPLDKTLTTTWIGEDRYQMPQSEYNHDICKILCHVYRQFSLQHGFPELFTDKYDCVYDHPLLSEDNEKVKAIGEVDYLVVNSVPMSGQFKHKESDWDELFDLLASSGKKVVTTRKVDSRYNFACTLDYDMNLLDIGCLALRAKNVIAVSTGPITTMVNRLSLKKDVSWKILVNCSLAVWYEPDDRFKIYKSIHDVVVSLPEFGLTGGDKPRRQVSFFNECRHGDCLWTLTYFSLILDCNDFDAVFYVNSQYLAELTQLIHPAFKDRITLRPIEECDRDRSINTWIGANDFNRISGKNRQEIQGICFDMFKEISAKHGILFPLKKRSEFVFDHPYHYCSNKMLDELGNPDFLFINSAPMSGQFTQSDEALEPIYEYLKGKKVFVTKRSHGLPCTLDYGLSLLQIGQVASRARIVVSLDTGPLCASVNKAALSKVESWFVLTGKRNPMSVFNRIGCNFSVSETAIEVVGRLRRYDAGKPRVSVLLSLYKGEHWLGEYLRFITEQSCFRDLQLVICHNCPTEGELSILDDFKKKHPLTVKHVISDRLTTWSESINICIENADSDLVALWNVDDIRTSDSLEVQCRHMELNPDDVGCFGDFLVTFEYGASRGTYTNRQYLRDNPSQMFTDMLIGPFFMWRRGVHEKIGWFDEQLKIAGDFDFAMRLVRLGHMGVLNCSLGSFLNAGKGLSTRAHYIEDIERAVIKLRYKIEMIPRELEAMTWSEFNEYDLVPSWFGERHSEVTKLSETERDLRPSVGQEKKDKKTSIIIKSYNRLSNLKLILESFYGQSVLPCEVIIADDGSTDGTIEWIDGLEDRYPFPVKYITRNHLGYKVSSLSAEAARFVTGDRILFTDVDVIHNPASVSCHQGLLDNQVGVGIIKSINQEGVSKITPEAILMFNSSIIPIAEQYQSQRSNLKFRSYDPNGCPVAVWGGNFSIPVSLYKKIGGHDLSFDVGWGGEDSDVGKRAVQAGGRAVWLDESVGYHLDHRLFQYSYQQKGAGVFYGRQ